MNRLTWKARCLSVLCACMMVALVGPPPDRPSNPLPEDTSTGISPDDGIDLCWVNGAGTKEVFVFMATDPKDIEQGVPLHSGPWTETIHVDNLMANTTYYWVVYNLGEVKYVEGAIWSFTTGDPK